LYALKFWLSRGYCREKYGDKKGGLIDGNDFALGDRCCDRPNNLCNGFLNILSGPAFVKGGLALKK
jgi:hypothetical protein|tara:strand:- start:156 stop:353 length:198 start_codon:yes stop_codon:yes gene_type:complete